MTEGGFFGGWAPGAIDREDLRAYEHDTATSMVSMGSADMGNLLRESEEMENIKGLKAVKVLKDALLVKVKQNREKHVSTFREARKAFEADVINTLGKAYTAAKEGDFDYWTPLKELQAPQDHTKDYDRVIAMLEMSLDKEIELPASEFSRYALDEWEWTAAFNNTIAKYSGRPR